MAAIGQALIQLLLDEGGNRTGDGPVAPPGSPPTQKFVGPWFSTQLILSLTIGLTSFMTFCILRTRWELVYMGRTKLKDFSPAPAHSTDTTSNNSKGRFFGWIIPTLRTSEFTVLQTVGLDAAVLLNFYRMAFTLFSLAAILAAVVLMPINLFRFGSTDSEPDVPTNGTYFNSTYFYAFSPINGTASIPANGTVPTPPPTLYDLILDPQTSSTLHLIFTYLFTFLCLAFFHRNFHRFVLARQSFALHLIHSISSRTVLVTNVPNHLRGDRALADYFENCGWEVESVSVCREVEPLRKVLERRTNALLGLERAWAEWVGNPANIKGYDPEIYSAKNKVAPTLTASPDRSPEPLIPGLEVPQSNDSRSNSRADVQAWQDLEEFSESHYHIHTTRPRPTIRPNWFGKAVDAIEYWEKNFRLADEEVKEMRKTARFGATHVAFVTFERAKDAQVACQVVHYPHHSQLITEPAPEPRDVVWSKVAISQREGQVRNIAVMAVMGALLLSWIPPVTSVASLLSYQEIKRVLPWLARLLDGSPRLAAIVQNSLPSLAIIAFNGLLPFFLGWLSYEQGYRSRSAAEYSLMKKYYLFLLISVLFIFLLISSYWALVRDLADTPMKIPEKLATALQASNARNFMVSYVMLQALGLMPLQLLNLGPLSGLGWARLFYTKTPRDYAEAYAPPMLNYGWVYPQSLLIFTVTLVYSVVSPLILVFGAIYFGVAYLVYKYKLLFIYFKPYESNGEAWRITFTRLLWALIIFQLFTTGLFSLRQSYVLPLAMVPLIAYTLWDSWVMFKDFGPLSNHLALSNLCEVERGDSADQVIGVRDEGEISRSQSGLNRRRYADNDETLYVAPSDKRTDYSQPPINNFYYGVLNTGRRRYAHPALSGLLPYPWLPAKAKPKAFGDGAAERRGVVLSLRRKKGGGGGGKKRRATTAARSEDGNVTEGGWGAGSGSRRSSAGAGGQLAGSGSGSQLSTSSTANPWRDPVSLPSPLLGPKDGRRSEARGRVVVPAEEENVWGDRRGEEEGEGDEEHEEEEEEELGKAASPSTYFHHPERRRTVSGIDGVMNGDGAPAQEGIGLPQ